MRLFLNGFGNVSAIEVGARRVARFVLRVGEHRRVDVLVVAEREERDLHRGVGDVHPFDFAPLAG